MEIRLFREYLVLSKLLNFSRAAEQLGMTQPVLSRHLKYLEEQFDTKLLDRNTHQVELTKTGKLLAEEAEKIIGQYESAFQVIRESLGKSQHSLSIMFLGAATREFFSDFLVHFRKHHEAISIDCRDTELDAIPGSIDRRECDLGFIVRPDRHQSDNSFRHLELFKDPLCLAVHKNHPLAKQQKVSIRELASWPLIGVDKKTSPLAGDCNSYFLERYGLNYGPDIVGHNLSTCCFNLELNESAVVLLPKHQSYLLGKNATLVEIEEKDCRFNVELIWDPKNKNPSIETFMSDLKSFLCNRPGYE
ncbi:LysR family transcriptional regulator [Cohaesibacter celericrescens]|uniref:LysR family transcriptional regulator n=1 Tax=Cohaesibacter celericrescens TaxID=2067669 RepID=A0A2N5XRP3_9HYPH|nr:LysR family transcriptional regulator [Cohaesibacter celericrescens]PLW77117.1 LysR family transcriptional regulator [Cohaesibacter celericrescens]